MTKATTKPAVTAGDTARTGMASAAELASKAAAEEPDDTVLSDDELAERTKTARETREAAEALGLTAGATMLPDDMLAKLEAMIAEGTLVLAKVGESLDLNQSILLEFKDLAAHPVIVPASAAIEDDADEDDSSSATSTVAAPLGAQLLDGLAQLEGLRDAVQAHTHGRETHRYNQALHDLRSVIEAHPAVKELTAAAA